MAKLESGFPTLAEFAAANCDIWEIDPEPKNMEFWRDKQL